MLDYRQLAHTSEVELATYDVAQVHLASAVGLPGSEAIDHDRCIEEIDSLTAYVREYTALWMSKEGRDNGGDTPSQARMRCLATALWRGAGIRYNPAKVAEDTPWELGDMFIHGALFGPGGTCATLPIIYTAVGRRLGYPLRLVSAWGPKWEHLFCRWDEPGGERFNVEVNDTGFSCPEVDHYRRYGQEKWKEEFGLYLLSKTPRQELSDFLAQRGFTWRAGGNLRSCVDSFAWAVGLCPGNGSYLEFLKGRYNDWLAEIKCRLPPRFPEVYLEIGKRRYPGGLDRNLECSVISMEMVDNLLKDREMETRWWRPLREGKKVERSPSEVRAVSLGNRIDFSFRFPANI
jgi:hypothetical protein